MKAIRIINSTVEYFVSDYDDQQAVKLHLYQSICDMSKTEAAHELGVTTRKGYDLRQMHLKHFKESEKYRRLIKEVEQVCYSDYYRKKWNDYNKHRKEISKRSAAMLIDQFPKRRYRERVKPQLKLNFLNQNP